MAVNILVVYFSPERELGAMVFTGLGAVLFLLVLSQNWLGIPLAAVRALGLGEMPVALVLTEQGCHTLNAATRGQAVCQLDPETKIGWACPVVLKSRIGSPFVFEVTSFDMDGKWPAQPTIAYAAKNRSSAQRTLRYQRIQISKTDVLSWPTIASLRFPGNDFRFDSRHVVSVWRDEARKLSVEQTKWLFDQCGGKLPAGISAEAPRTQVRRSNEPAKPDALEGP